MKKILLIILITLSFSNLVYCQYWDYQNYGYEYKTDTLDVNLYRIYSINEKSDTGNLFTFYIKDEKRVLHGIDKFWYLNGKLKSIQHHKNGKLMNVTSLFDSRGNLLKIGTLKEGNGILFKYIEQNDSVGVEYKINEQLEYKDGLLDGKGVHFFNYPKDTSIINTYKQGVLDGTSFYYYKTGELFEKKIFHKNEAVGKIQRWNQNGQPIDYSLTFNKSNNLYYISDTVCNGKIGVYGTGLYSQYIVWDLFFTNGKLDSLKQFRGFGTKLLDFSYNFIDSTRIYYKFSDLNMLEFSRSFKILSMEPNIVYHYDNGEIYVKVNEEIVKDGLWINYYEKSLQIKDVGRFKNGEFIDASYYDINGNLLKK